MQDLDDYSTIFVRYDLVSEVKKERKTRVTARNAVLQLVLDCVVNGDIQGADNAVNAALQDEDPMEVINEGLIKGMNEVSMLWEEGVYYLPQTILSSDAMLRGIDICEKKWERRWKKRES